MSEARLPAGEAQNGRNGQRAAAPAIWRCLGLAPTSVAFASLNKTQLSISSRILARMLGALWEVRVGKGDGGVAIPPPNWPNGLGQRHSTR